MSHDRGWKRLFRIGHSRHRVEEEVADELRFHMEGRVDRYVKSGMPEDEAWEKVRSECGDLEAARSELAARA